MLVKALIRDVQHDAEAQIGRVTIETTNPLHIMDIRVFTKSDTGKKNLAAFSAQKGKVIDIPLMAEVYKGQLQYQIPFGESIPKAV